MLCNESTKQRWERKLAEKKLVELKAVRYREEENLQGMKIFARGDKMDSAQFRRQKGKRD